MTAANHAETEAIDLERLADDLIDGLEPLDEHGQHVAVTLYRLLAEGKPVSHERLAGRADLPLESVNQLLDSWHGIFHEDAGNVVSLWGLAQPELEIGFEIDGNQLYTWCAWDSLFLPQILDKTARVHATAPTGETITLTVDPDGVREVSPPDTVLSFLRPPNGFDENVIQSFCHHVLFFPSPDAAGQWARERPGTFILTVEAGFELGRRWVGKRAGAAVRTA